MAVCPPVAYPTAVFSQAYFSLAVSNRICTLGAWPFSYTTMVALSLVVSVYSASGLKVPLLSVRPQSRPVLTLPEARGLAARGGLVWEDVSITGELGARKGAADDAQDGAVAGRDGADLHGGAEG